MTDLSDLMNVPMMGAKGCGDAICFLAAVDLLCSDEANSLTFVADNPDFGGPNSQVVCNGYWTNYQDKTFYGDTAFLALTEAAKAHNKWSGA